MTIGHAAAALIAAVIAASAVPSAGDQGTSGQPPRLRLRDVVASTVRYVSDYREQFAFLVADETYVQTRVMPRTRKSEQRAMRGELFLTYLPADREWIAVHDIAEVDGEPVPDRENLRQLIANGAELRGMVGKVADRNARFNLGGVRRNFNEPMLPLLLLDARRVDGLAFDLRDIVADGDTRLVTIAYRERDRPTLVRGPSGPIRSRGEITVEAGTGRVRRTYFELQDGAVLARLTTAYGLDEKLGLWVPTEFREQYDSSRDDETTEIVSCVARYTNYRRFTATGRVK
jgi:hypothetical protein